MLILPSNIAPPAGFLITFKSPAYSGDLTQVTGVSLLVQRQNGTKTTLAMGVVSATPFELVGQYIFQGVGEISGTGIYKVSPSLQVPGGFLPATPVAMFVSSPFDGPPQLSEVSYLGASVAIAPLAPQSLSVALPANLSTLATLGLQVGAFAHVATPDSYFRYLPSSVVSPNGATVLAAFGGGNWVEAIPTFVVG